MKESSQRDEFNLSLNPSILLDTPNNQHLFISPYQLPDDCLSNKPSNNINNNPVNFSNLDNLYQQYYLSNSDVSVHSKQSQNSSLSNPQDNFKNNSEENNRRNFSSNLTAGLNNNNNNGSNGSNSSQYFCCFKHFVQCSEYHSNKYSILKQSISSAILTQCNRYTDISIPLTTQSNPTLYITYLTKYPNMYELLDKFDSYQKMNLHLRCKDHLNLIHQKMMKLMKMKFFLH